MLPRIRGRFASLPRPRLLAVLPPVVLSLVAAGAITLYNQPVFKVAQVHVRGVQAVSTSQVLDAARLDGRHVLDISDRTIAESLASLPRVKGVTVNRLFPNEVELIVEERKPWAVWHVGSSNYVIDDEGVVLEAVAQPSASLPVLVYGGNAQLKPGTRVPLEPVRLALKLDRALPEMLKVKVKRFEYSENGGLLVITDGGWQARFGTGDDLDYKLATLKSIVETARARKIPFTAVDIRFGARPFIR
ncbi:MAG: FtsQ-type POTRA domain-containing protein [Dehalococcoidia bacterium]